MSSPEIGTPAPDFELPGLQLVDGEPVTSSYRLEGRIGPLVLAFYPGDATPTCTQQMCSYSSGLEEFTDLGAQVWGVSGQDLASHEKFARQFDLKIPLLADVDKKVVKAYGLTRFGGLHTARAVFVIDEAGLVRWSDVRTIGMSYQPNGDLVTALKELSLPA